MNYVDYKDEKFANRQLASLVASKVYYHLGEYGESLNSALGAGDLFDLSQKTAYVDTIICELSCCLDR